jgi:hypothetical protein
MTTAPVPYRQPFANAGRNSAEPVALVLGAAPHWNAAFTAQATIAGTAIEWLLGGGPNDDVVLFESRMGHGWWIDLRGQRKPIIVGATQGSFPVFQEDADQLILPRGAMLALPDMSRPGEYDRWLEVDAGGMSMPVQALVARRDHFTVMSVRPPDHRDHFSTLELTSKPYSDDARPQLRWQQVFPNRESAPSPALSDDTLIACGPDRLTFFAPDGAGVIDPAIGIAQGKVVAEIAVGLRLGLVSADANDRVWGFRLEDGALVGWDARGQSLGPALPLGVSASQPPVALPGGAIAVVAPGVALKVENSSVRWRTALPPDAAPLATADRAGQLLIRAGKHLLLLDPAGKQLWDSELPGTITSNPLITASGRVCVAVGLTLHCSQ